jgi:hypothetical protein
MKQQINLYKSLPRISRNWFGEMIVLQISAGFLALLFLVSLFQMITLQWAKYDVSSLQKKFIESNARFTKEQKSQGGFDLVQLQQELASKTQLLNLLHIKAQSEGGCPLLSDYFQSFSAGQLSGLWLTRFYIEPDTKNMTFSGGTYDPLLIVNWVKSLGKTPCFTGTQFQTIDIQNSGETDKSVMVFSISSTHAPAAGGKK